MNLRQVRAQAGSIAILAVLAVLGVGAATYVLINQRLVPPIYETYRVSLEFSDASGIVPGLGQPVRVSGVAVGTIVDSTVARGRARVTMELRRDDLPEVYADARATLQPITPLEDMELALDPGDPPARPLPDGAVIPIARTASPIELSDLLASLDTDTRAFLVSLISTLDEGTRGNADAFRRAARAFGPTVAQVRDITTELDGRRDDLARLVTNLDVVSRAATDDAQLAPLVSATARTLRAVASESDALEAALPELPGTLRQVRRSLDGAARLSDRLRPALTSLQPTVDRLPAALRALDGLATTATPVLSRQVRPFVRDATPAVGQLGAAVPPIAKATPFLSQSMLGLRYATNELAYNPPGDDEGGLFWLSWFAHNWASASSIEDAHGVIARTAFLASCQQVAALGDTGPLLDFLLGSPNTCPG